MLHKFHLSQLLRHKFLVFSLGHYQVISFRLLLDCRWKVMQYVIRDICAGLHVRDLHWKVVFHVSLSDIANLLFDGNFQEFIP